MINYTKYRTVEERINAFLSFCKKGCEKCPVKAPCKGSQHIGFAHWIDMEIPEEKILPCPFCGGEMGEACDYRTLICTNCRYELRRATHEEVVADHNAVAKKMVEK